jgi:hypothetical protein
MLAVQRVFFLILNQLSEGQTTVEFNIGRNVFARQAFTFLGIYSGILIFYLSHRVCASITVNNGSGRSGLG